METTYSRFDAAKFLGSEEAIAAFLADSAEGGDPVEMISALATVARARNMSALAESTGMSRSGLYKALSPEGNPSFVLVDKIAKTMGYRVALLPMEAPAPSTNKRPTKKRQPVAA